MRLGVPFIRQQYRYDCGVASIKMLLEYYGDKLQGRIAAPSGLSAGLLGMHLLEYGHDVEIVTLNPNVFTLSHAGMSQRQIVKHLRKLHRLRKRDSLTDLADFIEHGGHVRVKIPDEKDMRREIENGRPLCAVVTRRFLHKKDPSMDYHYDIVEGITKKYVYVLDPSRGQERYPIAYFMYAMYATAHRGYDGATLIKVRHSSRSQPVT